ncbi:hypothetical protein DFH09DRAFT_1314645 [Mycena vulgaris]|nr:hypothetical protein DFH09DRAFT_1314645 [Mycena vulgaris]
MPSKAGRKRKSRRAAFPATLLYLALPIVRDRLILTPLGAWISVICEDRSPLALAYASDFERIVLRRVARALVPRTGAEKLIL